MLRCRGHSLQCFSLVKEATVVKFSPPKLKNKQKLMENVACSVLKNCLFYCGMSPFGV